MCGDGVVTPPEACDDGNTANNDGCTATCAVQTGYGCTGAPSTCNPVCGDGMIVGAEACDDGNTANNDGCTAACAVQTGYGCTGAPSLCKPVCGDGMIVGAEACDDGNTANNDGCTAACAVQTGYGCTGAPSLCNPVCGDGMIAGVETCDDGNTMSGDGCSALCQLECIGETEPNAAYTSADGPYAVPVTLCGAITPGSDKDFFAITVSDVADLRLETTDGGITTCNTIDTIIYLYGTDGTTPIAIDDEGGINSCSLVDPAIVKGARHLSPGTYYARVSTYNNTLAPAYRLVVSYDALCGDGVVEGAEECEPGGAVPCTATCDRIPVCGDGHLDAPEQCDDDNTMSGDGCSPTCQYEGVTNEVEANDTFLQADNALAPITGSTTFVGSIGAVGDKDMFRMNVNAPSVVRFETFDSPLSKTCVGKATTMRLFNGAGTQIYTDNAGGIAGCSALVVNLNPGVYYVEVEDFGNNAMIPEYALEVAFQTSLGNELETNDTYQTATPLLGSDVYIYGNHAVNAEQDWFRIDVPFGKALRAEIIEGGTETCESGEVDSRLTLYSAGGVAGTEDDDLGRGRCTRMDGTGFPAANAGASVLAGTYYLQVRAGLSAPVGTTGQFEYKLVVTLR